MLHYFLHWYLQNFYHNSNLKLLVEKLNDTKQRIKYSKMTYTVVIQCSHLWVNYLYLNSSPREVITAEDRSLLFCRKQDKRHRNLVQHGKHKNFRTPKKSTRKIWKIPISSNFCNFSSFSIPYNVIFQVT